MKNLIGIPTVTELSELAQLFSLYSIPVIRCAPLCLRHSWGLGSYTVRSDQYICHIIPVSQCGPGLESRVWSTCGLALGPSARPRSPYFAEHIACTTHEASHDSHGPACCIRVQRYSRNLQTDPHRRAPPPHPPVADSKQGDIPTLRAVATPDHRAWVSPPPRRISMAPSPSGRIEQARARGSSSLRCGPLQAHFHDSSS